MGAKRARLLVIIAMMGVPTVARGTDHTAELLLGGAWNADSSLRIVQGGHDDLEITADWSTRPFEQPLYWALRFGREGESHGFALELHHHKVYLENPTTEIQSFSVTHGTNIVSLQYRWLRPRWSALALAGIVVAHPENTVRGERLGESGGLFDAGYHLAGPALGMGAGSALPMASWLELAAEARITAAWISVDVVGGEARFTNLAFHLLVGPRVRF